MTDMNETNTEVPTDEIGHRRRAMSLGAEIADLMKNIVARAGDYREIGVPAREWLSVVASNLPEKPARVIEWASGYLAPAIDIGLDMLGGQHVDEAAVKAFQAGMKIGDEANAAKADPEQEVEYNPEAVSLANARSYAISILETLKNKPEHDETECAAGHLAAAFLSLDDDLLRRAETPNTARMRDVISRLFGDAVKMTGPDGKVDEKQAPAMEVHVLLRGAPMQFSGILSTTPEGTLRLMTPVSNPGQPPVMIEQFFDYADVTSVALVREVKASPGSRIITSH